MGGRARRVGAGVGGAQPQAEDRQGDHYHPGEGAHGNERLAGLDDPGPAEPETGGFRARRAAAGQAREALAIIETTTRRSLHEMRLLVSMLRDTGDHDAELSPVPGLGDLDRLVAATAAAGVTVEVTIDGTGRGLSPATDLSAYRIVQEALTNVVRHAGPPTPGSSISYRPASWASR